MDKIWGRIEANRLYKKLCENKLMSKLLSRETINYVFFGLLTTLVSISTYAIAKYWFESRGWLAGEAGFVSEAVGRYAWLKYMPNLSGSLRIFVINIISWLTAVIFAFVTNKLYVFQSKTASICGVLRELSAFFGARIFSLLAETLIIILWVELFGGKEIIAKAIIGQVVVLILNFLLSKFFVFKKSKEVE